MCHISGPLSSLSNWQKKREREREREKETKRERDKELETERQREMGGLCTLHAHVALRTTERALL